MKKLIIGFISLFSLVAQAQIQVQVSPSQIAKDDAFQITLTQESIQDRGVPNLTVLKSDFIILGTEQNVNYSVINGQAQSSNQWIVTLQAKKAGILTIPAISIGSDKTSPVTINIAENPNSEKPQTDASQEEDLMLVAGVNETKPYVNQQVIYTVKLYNRKRLLDADYQGPKVDDALLIPLGDAKRYQTTIANKEYLVEEQNYALYPQKSGTLKITSPVFSALVYDLNPQRVKVQDKPVSLKVQPIPANFTGTTWLPAKTIKLSEQYEQTSQTISQGSTLTRTVTIEGVATPAQLLPTLKFDDGKEFNIYTEKGEEHNLFKQGELVGTVSHKVTYLFKEPGKIIIPEIKLPWFNTTTGKEEVAVLPPRSMEITPTASQNEAKTQTANDNNKAVQSSGITPTASNNWIWAIAATFALAWLITLGLWAWQRGSKQSEKGQYKKALEELNKACAECKPAKTRDALLKWAALHWPDAPILNLTDLNKLVRDAHLKNQLHLLSQVLYKDKEKTLWRGDELARSIQAISHAKPKKKGKVNALPPINPL